MNLIFLIFLIYIYTYHIGRIIFINEFLSLHCLAQSTSSK